MPAVHRSHAVAGTALLLASSILCGGALAQSVTVERVGHVCSIRCDGVDQHYGTYASGATKFYFTADDGVRGLEPWVAQPQGGPAQSLADIQPGKSGSSPGNMRTVGDILFFQAQTPAGNGWNEGRRVWRSDGTPTGTQPVDFPIPDSKFPDVDDGDAIIGTSRGVFVQTYFALWWVEPDGSAPRKLMDTVLQSQSAVEWQGGIYFVAGVCSPCGGDQTAKLYRFDPPSTLKALGAVPVPVPPAPYRHAYVSIAAIPAGIVVLPDLTNLWFSDGIGPPAARYQWPANWRATVLQSQVSNGRLLFPVVDNADGLQIWSTDGAASGTRAATHFPPLGYSDGPSLFANAGGDVLLNVTTSNLGYFPDAPSYPWYPALWMFDEAQPLGARAIHSLGSANGRPEPRVVGMLGGRTLFRATTEHVDAIQPSPADAYWITDGTTSGTAEITLAALGGNPLYPLSVAGGWMYTWGWVAPIGNDLFRFRVADDFPTRYATVDVAEYYHAGFNHYFMTGNPAEKALLDAGSFSGWQRTGFGFVAYAPGSGAPGASPVCRFYGRPDAGIDSHFYSALPSECAEVETIYASSWRKESSNVFEVNLPNPQNGWCQDATTPLYRAYNGKPNANHRYTIDEFDQNAMRVNGWQPEGYTSAGIVMCVPVTTRAN